MLCELLLQMPLVFQAEIAKIANTAWNSQSKIMDETMLLNCLQVICQQFITKSNALEIAAAFVYKLWGILLNNAFYRFVSHVVFCC